jgi:hypothetical protein
VPGEILGIALRNPLGRLVALHAAAIAHTRRLPPTPVSPRVGPRTASSRKVPTAPRPLPLSL